MSQKTFFKHLPVKLNRYLFGKKFMRIKSGQLKGYRWSTESSYDYIFGEYEESKTLETFCYWLQPNSVFYDIGANVGYYSLLANRFITSGKIEAFEPIPFLGEIFKTHIDSNKNHIQNNNITLHTFGISDTEKEVEFTNEPALRDGNTYVSGSASYNKNGRLIKVQCHSIDELIRQGYPAPDVIKIDVEGAEMDVLSGAAEVLQVHRPNILLATHDCHLPGVKEKCVSFLERLGYHVEHIDGRKKTMEGLDDFIAVRKN